MYGKFQFCRSGRIWEKHDKNFHMTKIYLITTEDGNNKLEKNIYWCGPSMLLYVTLQ